MHPQQYYGRTRYNFVEHPIISHVPDIKINPSMIAITNNKLYFLFML